MKNIESGNFRDLVSDCIRFFLYEESSGPFRQFLTLNDIDDAEEGLRFFTDFAMAIGEFQRDFSFTNLTEVNRARIAFNFWVQRVFGTGYTV